MKGGWEREHPTIGDQLYMRREVFPGCMTERDSGPRVTATVPAEAPAEAQHWRSFGRSRVDEATTMQLVQSWRGCDTLTV